MLKLITLSLFVMTFSSFATAGVVKIVGAANANNWRSGAAMVKVCSMAKSLAIEDAKNKCLQIGTPMETEGETTVLPVTLNTGHLECYVEYSLDCSADI